MTYHNLDGRDSLAGLDNWIEREEPMSGEQDHAGIGPPPNDEQQIYIDRDAADREIGFLNLRRAELERQLADCQQKLGEAWQRFDHAQASIDALDP